MKEDNLISVLIPVYNSSITLNELYYRLKSVLSKLTEDCYELIFINDGSSDNCWDILKHLAQENEKVIAINLTKNYGQHNALMCGFCHANGKYVITIDDDLQIPPEEIPLLYMEIQKGFDIVYGTYQEKQHTRFRNLGSNLIQFIYKKTFNINKKVTSFRILKKELVDQILAYEKSFTFIDGIISWYTDKIGNIVVKHLPRHNGDSGYSLTKLIVLALNMLTNFSIIPLQIASLMGLFFSITGFSLSSYFILKKIFWGIPVSGYTSLIVAVTLFSGVQLLTIGILGEYIGRIHINISQKPQYFIREAIKKGDKIL